MPEIFPALPWASFLALPVITAAASRGFNAGQRLLDHYGQKELLGRGAMRMWRAYGKRLEREVAVKFLLAMVALDVHAVADLRRENCSMTPLDRFTTL